MSTSNKDQDEKQEEEDRKPSPRQRGQESPLLLGQTNHSDNVAANLENNDNAPLDESAGTSSIISTSNSNVILSPSPDDILMGREWSSQNHPGNQKMRTFVEQYKENYWSRSLSEKGALVKELLRKLRKNGARFLKRREGNKEEAGWEIASRVEAYDKVCHVLRDKRRFKPEQNNATTTVPVNDQQFLNTTTTNAAVVGDRIARSRTNFQAAPVLVANARNANARMLQVGQQRSLLPTRENVRHQLLAPRDGDSQQHGNWNHPHSTTVSQSTSGEEARGAGSGGTTFDTSNSAQTTSISDTRNSSSDTSSTDDYLDMVEGMEDVNPAIKMALIKYLGQKRRTS